MLLVDAPCSSRGGIGFQKLRELKSAHDVHCKQWMPFQPND